MQTAAPERAEAATTPAKGPGLPARLFTAGMFIYLFVALFPPTLHAFYSNIDGHLLWGLNHLRHSGCVFGQDAVSTYGPLGYILRPLHIGNNLVEGATVQIFVHTLLIFASLMLAWRTNAPWRTGLFALMLIVPGMSISFAECRYELLICVVALCPLAFPRWAPVLAAVLGALAAGSCFVKFSLGVSALAQCIIGAVCWRGKHGPAAWPWIASLAVSYGVTMALASSVLFKSIENFQKWISGSLSIASSYSEVVSMNGSPGEPLAAIAMLAGYGVSLLWLKKVRSDLFIPACSMAGFIIFGFKHAFVRHDSGHVLFFIFAILASLSYLLLFAKRGKETGVIIAVFVASAVVFSSWYQLRQPTFESYMRFASCTEGMHSLACLRRWTKKLPIIDRLSDRCLQQYRLSPPLVSHIQTRGSTVDVVPFEVMYCAANEFKWSPSPVLQLYGAYTPELDARCAAHFESPGNPDFIIVHSAQDIDGRSTLLANPATWKAIMRNYEPLTRDRKGVLLLSKLITPRIEKIAPLAEETCGTTGSWIDVPHSSGLVYGKITLKRSVWGKVCSALYQIPPVNIDFFHASGRRSSYRLLPKLAETGVILNCAPSDVHELGQLVSGSCRDRVVRFRVRVPSGRLFEREIRVSWLSAATPMEWRSHTPLRYDNRKSADSPHCHIDCVGSVLIAGKSRMEVDLLTDEVLSLSGWAADKKNQKAAGGVVLSIDGHRDLPAAYGFSRPDVQEFLHHPAYSNTGFQALLCGDDLPQGRHTIRVKVISADRTCFYDAGFALVVNRK